MSQRERQMPVPTTRKNRADGRLKLRGVGKVIQELREEANLSQQELANTIRCDKTQLSKYENDRLALSLAAIDRIAQAVNLPVEAVVLRCFKHLFPALSSPESEVGQLLESLVTAIEKRQKKRSRRVEGSSRPCPKGPRSQVPPGSEKGP
jgi:transcriptional regulator with XRE-family HTH domain